MTADLLEGKKRDKCYKHSFSLSYCGMYADSPRDEH